MLRQLSLVLGPWEGYRVPYVCMLDWALHYQIWSHGNFSCMRASNQKGIRMGTWLNYKNLFGTGCCHITIMVYTVMMSVSNPSTSWWPAVTQWASKWILIAARVAYIMIVWNPPACHTPVFPIKNHVWMYYKISSCRLPIIQPDAYLIIFEAFFATLKAYPLWWSVATISFLGGQQEQQRSQAEGKREHLQGN